MCSTKLNSIWVQLFFSFICSILLFALIAGCTGPAKPRSLEDYKKRVEELEHERIALVSCIEWVGIKYLSYDTNTFTGRIDTLSPISHANDFIYNWLCLNSGNENGYTSCSSTEPPPEIKSLHNVLCRHLKTMKDALFICKNELTYLMCGSASCNETRLFLNLKRFEDAVPKFESALDQLSNKLRQL